MDANKAKKLREIDYKILPTCGTCKYAEMSFWWGVCTLHEYDHLKHTGSPRNLSIRTDGSCGSYEATSLKWDDSEAWKEFDGS